MIGISRRIEVFSGAFGPDSAFFASGAHLRAFALPAGLTQCQIRDKWRRFGAFQGCFGGISAVCALRLGNEAGLPRITTMPL